MYEQFGENVFVIDRGEDEAVVIVEKKRPVTVEMNIDRLGL